MAKSVSVSVLEEENARLRAELAELKRRLLYNTLEQSINERQDGSQLQDFLKNNCGFTFSAEQFCLLLLYNRPVDDPTLGAPTLDSNWILSLDESAGSFTMRQHDSWSPHWDLSLRAKIEQLIRDQLPECSTYFLRADRDLCCLVNAALLDTDDLFTAMTAAAEQIEQHCGVKIAAAISRTQSECLKLQELYEECMLLHDYGWNETAPVLRFDQLPQFSGDSAEDASAAVLERRFLSCITTFEFYQASGILDRMNQSMLRRQIPMEAAVSITLNRLMNVMAMVGLNAEDPLCSELRETMDLIGHIRSFPDLMNKTRDFFAQLDDVFQAMQESTGSKSAAIMRFIESNYQNPELGAAMICDRVRISPAYLSKTMKQQTGMGVVDAIHAVRLREARQLLENTALSIDQIATAVGFSNRWILIRSFKSRLGQTPSEYRSSLRAAAEADAGSGD